MRRTSWNALGTLALVVTVLSLPMLAVKGATAAEPPEPTTFGVPSGQEVEYHPDGPALVGDTGAQDTPLGQVPDFTVDLILLECGYSVAGDGTVWCGTDGRPSSTPRPPAPTPAPTPSPGPTRGPAGTPDDSPRSAGPRSDLPPADRGPVSASPAPAAEEEPEPQAGPPVLAPEAIDPAVPSVDDRTDTVAGPWRPTDNVGDVLTLGVTAFALLAVLGRRGLASRSMVGWKRRYRVSTETQEGSVLFADIASYEFDAEAGGPGDRSRLWRLLSGWWLMDRISRMTPLNLSRRAPLVARILADGAYLRAIFGMFWLFGPVAGFTLGLIAAHDTGGYPVAGAFGLTAALLVIASLDATSGLLGVVGFGLGVLIWGPGDLGLAPSLRSFLGMAALWFAIPLIASAARPLRRLREPGARYPWDRLGDAVISSLIGAWAVQGAVGGLPGLSGLDLPIAEDADRLALIALGVMLARVGVEELATRLFPERLRAVDPGLLPEPGTARLLAAAVLRTGVFLFVAYAFVGPCWQLWVGGAIFLLPQLLDLRADEFPNSPRLFAVIPRGIAMTLFMIIVGGLFARLVQDQLSDPANTLQNGFVLLALPGFAISLISLFGRDGTRPPWAWRWEFLGAGVVIASVWLVLAGW